MTGHSGCVVRADIEVVRSGGGIRRCREDRSQHDRRSRADCYWVPRIECAGCAGQGAGVTGRVDSAGIIRRGRDGEVGGALGSRRERERLGAGKLVVRNVERDHEGMGYRAGSSTHEKLVAAHAQNGGVHGDIRSRRDGCHGGRIHAATAGSRNQRAGQGNGPGKSVYAVTLIGPLVVVLPAFTVGKEVGSLTVKSGLLLRIWRTTLVWCIV